MSVSKIEQSELFKGYGYIEVTGAILGKSVLEKILIKGGMHPRMRLLTGLLATALDKDTGPSEDASFAWSAIAGTGAHVSILHRDGRVAAVAGGLDAIHTIVPFIAGTANVGDEIFEADEDVVYAATVAAGADADAGLVIAKFEVLGE